MARMITRANHRTTCSKTAPPLADEFPEQLFSTKTGRGRERRAMRLPTGRGGPDETLLPTLTLLFRCVCACPPQGFKTNSARKFVPGGGGEEFPRVLYGGLHQPRATEIAGDQSNQSLSYIYIYIIYIEVFFTITGDHS